MKIWIDDLRPVPDFTWISFKSSENAIKYLDFLMRRFPYTKREAISFDHDLGGDDTTRPVVIWMIENDFKFENYYVHSANPVGRQWLEGMIERYLQ